MLLIDPDRQIRFADLSGDYNPLHVDFLEARRSQFGSCVVHGIHLVLAGLGVLPLRQRSRLVKLDAQFRGAVLVGETVWVRGDSDGGEGEYQVEIGVGEQTRTLMRVTLETAPVVLVPHQVAGSSGFRRAVTSMSDPHLLEAASGTEPLAYDESLAADLFPSVQAGLVPAHLAALLGITRVVGMKCPGQWALFRRLIWTRSEDVTQVDKLNWWVKSVNTRYSLVHVGLNTAGVEASAEVIVRPPPPAQASTDRVRHYVRPGEFQNVRALVVGGSRGLGELAAKFMSAGGAAVLLTFNSGDADAKRVAAELGENAETCQLRAEAPSADASRRILKFKPTHVLFFATPAIPKNTTDAFDLNAYERLKNVYERGLRSVLELADKGGSLRGVFYPSSVYVADRQPGFAEYVAAKVDGEAVCSSWQDEHRDQRVVVNRLPPLVTDQTAARLGSDTAGNVDVLVAALREMEPFD